MSAIEQIVEPRESRWNPQTLRSLTVNIRTIALSAALTMVFGAAPSRAGTIISNLPGNDVTLSDLVVPNFLRSKAVGFTMPSGVSYSLDSVVMRLFSTDPSNQIGVVLEGSSGGLPTGVVLDTFAVPTLTDYVQPVTLTPISPYLLEPSTTYFIVAYGISGSGDVAWLGNSPPIIPTGVATFAGYYADNSGAASLAPTGSATVLNSFAVNASAVPEPASLTMGAIAVVIGLGFGSRPRRRTA